MDIVGPLTGKISGKNRPFDKIVADARHAVFAVMRVRPVPQGRFQAWILGSGFFVSSKIFLTCAHVLTHPSNPHIDGDRYDLISTTGTTRTVWSIQNAITGNNVHLFQDTDLALLSVDGGQTRSYLPLEYNDVPIGTEIGVAGYPAPNLQTVNGNLVLDGLIYRVAKNVLTATYTTNFNTNTGTVFTNIPVMEVNFLFVPGNSGGPIFSAVNGRVIGYVHGFRTHKVEEKIETTAPTLVLPAGMSNSYILSNSALYSVGISLGRVRAHLETLGVTL
jgi:S1-C subfamily serine protease